MGAMGREDLRSRSRRVGDVFHRVARSPVSLATPTHVTIAAQKPMEGLYYYTSLSLPVEHDVYHCFAHSRR